MALESVSAPTVSGGDFRRKQIGRNRVPLVIRGPVGTRQGPFADADQYVAYRASGVGDLIDDKGGIEDWKIRGHMWAVGHDESLRLSVAGIEDWESDEGKARFRDVRKRSEVVSGMAAKKEAGTDLHALLTRIDRGLSLPATLPARVQPSLAAYRHTISHFQVLGIELTVVCDELGIGGSLDKLVSPLGVMVPVDRDGAQFAPVVTPEDVIVADVKTSGTAKYFGCAFAGQLYPYAASYAYREEEDPDALDRQDDQGVDPWTPAARLARVTAVHRTAHGARTDVALLIHVPYGGATADLHWFDLVQGREVAVHAMGTRALRARGKRMCAPAQLPEVAPAPRPTFAGQVFDTVRTGHEVQRLLEAMRRCTTQRELVDLRAANAHLWNDELNAAGGELFARLAAVEVAS